MRDAIAILKKYWGHEQFRPMQQEIINAVLEKKDVLALLPTGGGKSICFQVPALMMDGLCIVVSPLIALMKDQVQNLNQKGIPALAIFSGMSFPEVRHTLETAANGKCKFLYVSPERLETRLFEEYLPAMDICLIAIDEAHCISQWGYDFRPSYLKTAALREEIGDAPIIALTASATLDVQNDICDKLLFSKNQKRFQQSFARPNLNYAVIEPPSKQQKLIELLKESRGSSIVYANSRKQSQQISELLLQHGLSADFYHAGLSNQERSKKQNDWIENKTSTIVCTNAFGMGIDKPDVRMVVHVSIPESLENYYQEAGRAGRDGRDSKAILLFDRKEFTALREINKLRYPEIELLKKLYIDLMNHLQVPAGIGENQSFDFDISSFAENFKWNMLQANYGIQALAQEGLFFLAENTFKPSQLVFTVSKEQLFEVEKTYPELDSTIKGLLRSYEGIFDYPVYIHETKLAKLTSTPIAVVHKNLSRLKHLRVVNYAPAAEKPQLVLLKNRMYKDDFRFDRKSYEYRKKRHLERLEQMIVFTQNTTDCRSKLIAEYFNDNSTELCKNCDNCEKNQLQPLSKELFEKISNAVSNVLEDQPVSYSRIENTLKSGFAKEYIKEVVKYLQAEKVIKVDKYGNFSK